MTRDFSVLNNLTVPPFLHLRAFHLLMVFELFVNGWEICFSSFEKLHFVLKVLKKKEKERCIKLISFSCMLIKSTEKYEAKIVFIYHD